MLETFWEFIIKFSVEGMDGEGNSTELQSSLLLSACRPKWQKFEKRITLSAFLNTKVSQKFQEEPGNEVCLGLFRFIVAILWLAGLAGRPRWRRAATVPQVLWVWAAAPGRVPRTHCQRARKCARLSPVGGHHERDFLFRRAARPP